MAASKDNLALFEIQTQSYWLCISVILTLGVSSAAMSQAREEEKQREEGHSSPLPPHFFHTRNYFPTTSAASPSFPSTASKDFSGECGQQCPSHPRAHSLWGPAEDPELLPSTAAFIPTLLTRGEHPDCGGMFTLSSPNDRQRERRKQHCLTLPVQRTSLHLAHHTTLP